MMRDIPIRIAGQELTIRSDEDEDYVRVLADYVDGKIRDIARGQRGVTTLNLALTAALTIADELQKLRNSGGSVDIALDALSDRIQAALESTPLRP